MSSQPATLNLSAYQGASFNEVLTWTAGGTPVDLTGATAAMKIKNGSSVLATLTTENGGITLGGNTGRITLTLDESTTAELPAVSSAEYDLLVKMGGNVRALLAGGFTVRKGTTLAV